jgi:hypothetical protein
MKIKFIWMALLALSFTNLATAQIKDTDNIQSLKDQIKAISKEIESLVSKIDSTNIEAVAESLEDEVDALEDKLDNLGDRIEDAKPDSDDETSIQTDVTKTKKIRAPRRTKAFFHIGTGVNGLASNKTVSGEFYPEVNIGQSWFLELGYNFRTRIGGANSPVGLLYGLDFTTANFDIKGNDRLVYLNDQVDFIRETDLLGNSIALEDNDIGRIWYLSAPVGLDFKLGKKVRLKVGGYGGVRLTSHTNYKYKNGTTGERTSVKSTDSYGLSDFRYGSFIGLGGRSVTVQASYDLNPLFASTNVYDFNAYRVGVKWQF